MTASNQHPARIQFLCLLFLLAAGQAAALDPGRRVTQYTLQSWQTEQGLPQNSVVALRQTRDGYVWLGTQEGLVRFDGSRFVVFDRRNTPALKSNWISALHEDREGNLWIGTRGGGLTRMRGGRFTAFGLETGLPNDRVRSFGEDSDGRVWVGTAGGGMCRLEGSRCHAFGLAQGLPHDHVIALHPDRIGGGLWIGTFGGGLSHLGRDGRLQVYGARDGLPHDRISSLQQDEDGTLWMGTFGGGLIRFAQGRFTTFGQAAGLPNDRIWSLLRDRDGNLWVATNAGLGRFRDGHFDTLSAAQGLSHEAVQSLMEDAEGSLWVGTWSGLNLLGNGKVLVYGVPEGLGSNVVTSLHEDRQGAVWIGTDGGGLNRLKDGGITTFTRRDGLSHDQVSSILEDRQGNLWVGTIGGGLNRFRGGRFTSFGTNDGLPIEVVSALYEDSAGTLWVGTSGGGLARWRGGRFETFTSREGLSNNVVVSIVEDAEGTLWAGTSGGGLNRYADGRFTAITAKEGLSDDRVAALRGEPDGALWIGTSGGGLNRRLPDGRLAAATTRHGLFDDRVFAILDDDAGNFWMSCNRGIFRNTRRELAAVLEGRQSRLESVSYGTADGMRSAECNGEYQPCALKTRDGRLWFPTMKGAVVLDPARLPVNRREPPMALESILVDGKAVEVAEGALHIPAGSLSLEVQYTALTFVAPERVRFRYRLEGFDPDWVDAGSRRSARYTSLPPGEFTFRVKASNADGIWNEKGVALAVRRLPFFYETRAFQVLLAGVLVLLGAGLQRFRLRRLKQRAEELERIVAEQTRDLRTANEELRQAQDKLASMAEARPEKIEDVAGWGARMAEEIGQAIHATRIHVWRVEGGGFVPLTPAASTQPTWEHLKAARAADIGGQPGPVLVPVTGMTDEVRGALVVEGPVVWTDTERRLVKGLAQQLGGALDLQHLRHQLTTTAARQAEVRQRMLERGVATLSLCPHCGGCYDDAVGRCPADDAELDGSRLLPFRVWDRYRLVRLLGEGGMGSVFAAHDERLQRDVALKVIRAEKLTDAESRFRLDREARALAQVHHPSVIDLYDSGELEDGSAFLVMELLSGWDLADVLDEHGPGSPLQVAVLLRQVGPALKAAHQAGVVHRDVKPANVFLVPHGESFQAKILDFGLAKSMRVEPALTQSGMLMGTPGYMSPEQVEGGITLDGRTDVYSLAAVAFEALTGERVVPRQEVARMLVEVLYGTPPSVSSLRPGITPEVDACFEAAFAKSRDARPGDIEAWAVETATLLEMGPGPRSAGWPLALLSVPPVRRARTSPAAPTP